MLPGKLFPRLLRSVVAALALCSARAAQCELQFVIPPEPPPDDGSGWKLVQAGASFAVAGHGAVHIYEQDGLTASITPSSCSTAAS